MTQEREWLRPEIRGDMRLRPIHGTEPHEWVDKAGNPWTPDAKDDACNACGCTPDCPAHAATPTQAPEGGTATSEARLTDELLEELGRAAIWADAHQEDPVAAMRQALASQGTKPEVEPDDTALRDALTDALLRTNSDLFADMAEVYADTILGYLHGSIRKRLNQWAREVLAPQVTVADGTQGMRRGE